MSRESLTGSRIRERRSIAGMRQAELARKVGVSPSYLNLIEHNRRRIGGKLLLDIAGVLQVEPAMLAEGAEAALLVALREAAADAPQIQAETDRVEEFAGRFPGWAEVLAHSQRRIAGLERRVEILTDRVTHDPQLAASLHEVLSTAAAIRSTAAILAEPGDVTPEWQQRFHRNIDEDSARLADSSKALVRYLDEAGQTEDKIASPLEVVEAYCAAQGFFFEALEKPEADIDAFVAGAVELGTPAVCHIARGVLAQYAADARAMPLEAFQAAIAKEGPDPLRLAERFGVGLAPVLRRLATVPSAVSGGAAGLLVCDNSGTVLFRKPIAGFAMPRFGAACPLWPIFSALNRPGSPLYARVEQVGQDAPQFDCFAATEPVGPRALNVDPVYRATMLILPVEHGVLAPPEGPRPVGNSCRICPRDACTVRREPSLLS